ncbi:hypothetical protein ABPG74_018468 [Tetrahymena malaccensis]
MNIGQKRWQQKCQILDLIFVLKIKKIYKHNINMIKYFLRKAYIIYEQSISKIFSRQIIYIIYSFFRQVCWLVQVIIELSKEGLLSNLWNHYVFLFVQFLVIYIIGVNNSNVLCLNQIEKGCQALDEPQLLQTMFRQPSETLNYQQKLDCFKQSSQPFIGVAQFACIS